MHARPEHPHTVAAIVNVLRQVHGDDLARVKDGVSLTVLMTPCCARR